MMTFLLEWVLWDLFLLLVIYVLSCKINWYDLLYFSGQVIESASKWKWGILGRMGYQLGIYEIIG